MAYTTKLRQMNVSGRVKMLTNLHRTTREVDRMLRIFRLTQQKQTVVSLWLGFEPVATFMNKIDGKRGSHGTLRYKVSLMDWGCKQHNLQSKLVSLRQT
jgi:hypothetical protein